MFTVTLEQHAKLWKDLLEFYFPYDGKNKPRGIDFTAGTKAIYWDMLPKDKLCPCCKELHYDFTFCDRDPLYLHEKQLRIEFFDEIIYKLSQTKKWKKVSEEARIKEAKTRVDERIHKSLDPLRDIHVKDIDSDSYIEFGDFNFGCADFPYLIGRQNAFNYTNKKKYPTSSHSQALYGDRSWGTSQLGTYVANPSVKAFNDRVKKLNVRAAEVILPGGLLFVKVMNVRHNKELINHDVTFINELTNFKSVDRSTYIRTSGATTWKLEKHMQNINGFWLVFERLAKKIE